MNDQHTRDPRFIDTLRSDTNKGCSDKAMCVPCLTVLCHGNPARIGERLLLPGLVVGQAQSISRMEGAFCHPGAEQGSPLLDPYLSRSPLVLHRGGQPGTIIVTPGKGPVHVDGHPVPTEGFTLSHDRLLAGVTLRLTGRTLLLLHLRAEPPACRIPNLIGDSDAIRTLRAALLLAAQHDDPVLIRGETGTGKELVASALHRHGRRATGPFVAVNMATLGEGMAASTLFGHVRGAFTGADRSRRGLFEQAHGGVLFLDEIGDTPATVQPMLLRALETGFITPLGAEKGKHVDTRVVAATDLDLEGATNDKTFRAPLWHRLAAQTLRAPSLRERRDDIGRLLLHFMRQVLEENGQPHRLLEAHDGQEPCLRATWVEALTLHPCTGNVRELRNLARNHALSLIHGVAIAGANAPTPQPFPAADLPGPHNGPVQPSGEPGPRPSPLPRAHSPQTTTATGNDMPTYPPPRAIGDVPTEPSRLPAPAPAPTEEAMLAALQRHDFVPERAAKALGIASSTMHYFMRKSGQIRRATDIPDGEIEAVLRQTAGDLDQAARELQVSKRALGMTVRQRGLLSLAR